MVNKTIEIGGKHRPVNFGRNALIEFEEITGQDLLDGSNKRVFVSHKSWRAFAFAALKWGLYVPDSNKEPAIDFNLIQVGDWITERPDAMADIFDAYVGSIPEGEKKVNASQKTEAN